MPALSLDSLNDRPELVQLNVITYTTGVQLDPYRDLQNQILCIHCDGREDAHVFNPGKAPAGRAGTAEGKDVLAVPGGRLSEARAPATRPAQRQPWDSSLGASLELHTVAPVL